MSPAYRALITIIALVSVLVPLTMAELAIGDVEVVDAHGKYFLFFTITTDTSAISLYPFFQDGIVSLGGCTPGDQHRILFKDSVLQSGGSTTAAVYCPGALDGQANFTFTYHNYTSEPPELMITDPIQVDFTIDDLTRLDLVEGGFIECAVGKEARDLPISIGHRVELGVGGEQDVAYYVTNMLADGFYPLLIKYSFTFLEFNESEGRLRIEGNNTEVVNFTFDCADGMDTKKDIGNITVYHRDIDCASENDASKAVLWVGYNNEDIIVVDNDMASGEYYAHMEFPPQSWRFSFHRDENAIQTIVTKCMLFKDTVMYALVRNATHLSYQEGKPQIDVSQLSKLSGRLTSASRELIDGRLVYRYTSNYTHVKYGEDPQPISALPKWYVEKEVLITREINGQGQEMVRQVPTEWDLDFLAHGISGEGVVSWNFSSAEYGVEYNITTVYLVITPVDIYAPDTIEVVPVQNNTVAFTLRNNMVDGDIRLCAKASTGWHTLVRKNETNLPCQNITVAKGDEAETQVLFWSDGEETGTVKIEVYNTRDGLLVGTKGVEVGAARFKKFNIGTYSCAVAVPPAGELAETSCDLSFRNEGNLAEVVYYSVILDTITPAFSMNQVQLSKYSERTTNHTAIMYGCTLTDGEKKLLAHLDKSLFFSQLATMVTGEVSELAGSYTVAFGTTKGLLININQTAYDALRTSLTTMLATPTLGNAKELTSTITDYKFTLISHLMGKCELATTSLVNATLMVCSEDPASGCSERTITMNSFKFTPSFNITNTHPKLYLRPGDKASAIVSLTNGQGFPIRFKLSSNDACSKYIGAIDKETEPMEVYDIALNITASTDKSDECTFIVTAHPVGVADAALSTELELVITKEDHFGMKMSATSSLSGVPGETVEFFVNVSNTGNVEDTYDIVINGTGDTVLGSPITRSLKAAAYQPLVIPFTMGLPENAAGTYTLLATVTSQTKPGEITESMPINIDILRPNIVVDIPPKLEKGSVIKIKNNGTAPATFKLTLDGELKNCLSIKDKEYTVEDGKEIELTVDFRCKVSEMDDKNKKLTLGIDGGKQLSFNKVTRVVTRTLDDIDTDPGQPTSTPEPTATPAPTPAATPEPTEDAGDDDFAEDPYDKPEPTPDPEVSGTTTEGGSSAMLYAIAALGGILLLAGGGVAFMMQKEAARKAAMKANLQKAMTSYSGGQQQNQQQWGSGGYR